MRQQATAFSEVLEAPAGRSRLLSRLYREIGLAAVAVELELAREELDLDVAQAVERGARYLAGPAATGPGLLRGQRRADRSAKDIARTWSAASGARFPSVRRRFARPQPPLTSKLDGDIAASGVRIGADLLVRLVHELLELGLRQRGILDRAA